MTPLDTERMGRNGQLAMAGAEALGVSSGPISRNAGSCVQCSSCPYGCKIDAKRAMHVSYLPRAVAAGARVRAGVEARRLLTEEGRAAGVECVAGGPAGGSNSRRRAYTVRARRATIVAGGAFGTPELLIRSGVGGRQVGRDLHIHPACWVGARYEEEVRGWDGVMQSYYIDQWESERVLLEATFTPLAFGGAWLQGAGRAHQEAMLDFGHIASIGVQLADRSVGRVRMLGDGSMGAATGLPTTTRSASSSASHGRRKSISRPARPRSTRTSPRAGVLRPAVSRISSRPASRPPSCASRRSTRWARRGSQATEGAGVCDERWRGATARGPLRRRRLALSHRRPRQPDDDHRRLRQAGRRRTRDA